MSRLLSVGASCGARMISTRRAVVKPFTHSSVAPVRRHLVKANFFKFGKNGLGAEDAGVVGSQGRNDYSYDDVEQYFSYMGFLAMETNYDRMEKMLATGLAPIDVILLLACEENDTPKVQEILKAGADITVKDLKGRTPLEIATKPALIEVLKTFEATRKVSA